MKILIAADGHLGEFHGNAYGERFSRLGHKVSYFKWQSYFKNYPYAEHYGLKPNIISSAYYRAQNKFKLGPAIKKINNDLINQCKSEKPDLLFIYRGTHILPKTIRSIKGLGVIVFGYNNDDPFSDTYKPYFWRHFINATPFYNHVFYYRPKNEIDYLEIGCKNISLLRSSYIKEANFKIDQAKNPDFNCDLIFIGHYENDDRDKIFLDLLKSGYDLKIYGTHWDLSPLCNEIETLLGYKIKPLYGEDYNLAHNSAKISLVVLSKINNDSYTRRCFEIPATGTLMLSERTDDLKSLFIEDKEAVYFSSPKELTKKIDMILADDNLRKSIANSGYQKLLASGHEVTDRVKEIIKVYNKCKKQ